VDWYWAAENEKTQNEHLLFIEKSTSFYVCTVSTGLAQCDSAGLCEAAHQRTVFGTAVQLVGFEFVHGPAYFVCAS
jgi:hypothetical protein